MIRNLLALAGLAAIALVAAMGLQAYGYFDDGLDGPPPRIAVSYAGLDLTRPEGVRILEQRINAAVADVCPRESGRSLRERQAERECRRHAIAMVEPQVADAVARAEARGRFAAAPPPPLPSREDEDAELARAEADRMLPRYPAPAPVALSTAEAPPPPARRLVRRTTTTTVTTTRTVRGVRTAPHRARASVAAKRPKHRSTAYARRPAVPGSWLPPAAWRAIERANARAFATGRLVRWWSPGRSGYVTVSAARRIGGAQCRNLRVVKQAGARQVVVAEGTRCRLPDGRIVARDCP